MRRRRWFMIRLAGLGVVAIAACAASLASAAPDRSTGPPAPVPAAGVTQIVNGPSVALAPHTTGHQTVNCPVGTLALSGGAQSPGSNLHVWIVDSYPTAGGASWTASERNQSPTPATFNATVLCADPQPGYNIRSRPASIPAFEVVQAAAICHRSATHATGGGFRHARYGVWGSLPSEALADRTGWTVGANSLRRAGPDLNVYVYTICVNLDTLSLSRTDDIPSPAGQRTEADSECPAGKTLAGGGNFTPTPSYTNPRISLASSSPQPLTHPLDPFWVTAENNNTPKGTVMVGIGICGTID